MHWNIKFENFCNKNPHWYLSYPYLAEKNRLDSIYSPGLLFTVYNVGRAAGFSGNGNKVCLKAEPFSSNISFLLISDLLRVLKAVKAKQSAVDGQGMGRQLIVCPGTWAHTHSQLISLPLTELGLQASLM
jgi:hypothetical protein